MFVPVLRKLFASILSPRAPRPLRRRTRPVTPRRFMLEALEERVVPSVSLITDHPDYQPGATALFTATGFDPHARVKFTVVETSVHPHQVRGVWFVRDGGSRDLDGTINGQVVTSWYVDPAYSLGQSFTVHATGRSG